MEKITVSDNLPPFEDLPSFYNENAQCALNEYHRRINKIIFRECKELDWHQIEQKYSNEGEQFLNHLNNVYLTREEGCSEKDYVEEMTENYINIGTRLMKSIPGFNLD